MRVSTLLNGQLRRIGQDKSMNNETTSKRALRVGIAGPVGSGKTALVECLCRQMAKQYSIGVVTNDIYTQEDAQFLLRRGVLPLERIRGVETGACPHSAIRDDVSMNLEAIVDLEETLPGLQLILVESGGDNIAASFSPELVDVWIYVMDVTNGEKMPRKGGPGVTRSDLLVINKIDLAKFVGASLEVMERDTQEKRQDKCFIFSDLQSGKGVHDIVLWVEHEMQHSLRPQLEDGRLLAEGWVSDHHH